ncbi:hypothetical protein C2G38_2274912 [Gigaspora rosea]|uniref:Uncharacterized protein n=1 Tax=Gigaspora rosea TaxID=44941 RepID=A0A397UA96_9GLOM|nr:hypothetical protein C2G38_2274912 [Gigaspora rosea]
MDSRFPHIGQGFQNFTMDPLLQPILSDWYMTQNIQEEDMADTKLDEALKIEHALLLKLFPDSFNNLPNLYINRHHVQNARNFGTLTNTSVGIKEMVYKIFKSSVSKMNCKNIEFDFIRRHNTLQMIRYLINGGMDSRFPHIGQGFQNFMMDPLLQPILSDWYMTQNIQEEDMADTNTNITSHDDKIRNIKTRRCLLKSEIHKLSLPEKLDNNNQFTYDVISDMTFTSKKGLR